jgi:RNA polymerase sigma-70 factor (ECF subfamily)
VAGGRRILDAEAIGEVFEAFRRGEAGAIERVRSWVSAVVRGGNWRFDDAEAVIQETLLKLTRIARSKRVAEPGAFQKFVYRVAKNTSVSTYHRQRRRETEQTEQVLGRIVAPGPTPDDDVEHRERWEALLYVFGRLPTACRELWDWVYREERSAAEIGERLGISAGNVRVRVHRCLERAREILGDLESRGGTASRSR